MRVQDPQRALEYCKTNTCFLSSFRDDKCCSHHAEGQFNPNPMKKTVTNFGYPTAEHVDSGNIKFKIGCRSYLYQLFSKREF
jgi:hypothetical protein